MPATFVCHGGGPLPLLGADPATTHSLTHYPSTLPATPTSILIISAHWVTPSLPHSLTPTVSITSGPKHPLLFDYSGFPSRAYEYTYPAPGSPLLASKVSELLARKDISSHMDTTRGYDHGAFVPLKLMFPDATIPVVQVSLMGSMDPLQHIKMGQALAPLRDEGVLILTSGMSFHNFEYIFTRSSSKKAEGVAHSKVFDDHLVSTLAPPQGSRITLKDQMSSMVNWTQAPSARACHPVGGEEHLLPLHVAFGAAVGDIDLDDDTAVIAKYQTVGTDFIYSNFEFY
jgi:aromatic ring-opening dioxygenase catalytic subunit (LigB family)